MSNYVKIVDYASKDALATGNPSKAVRGAELGPEFDAIAAMSATKADTSMAAQFLLFDGGAASPGLAFVNETNTGLYRAGANDVRFSIGGADTLFIAVASFTAPSFIPTSATVPTNGLYLAAANTVALATNTTARLSINSTGVVTNWEGTNNVGSAGLMQTASQENGSFTGTLTGCTTSPTATVNWTRVGTNVTMMLPAGLTATSNSTACTVTGAPAALAPTRTQNILARVLDNGSLGAGGVTMTGASSTITLTNTETLSGSGFTAAGTKGVAVNSMWTYSLT